MARNASLTAVGAKAGISIAGLPCVGIQVTGTWSGTLQFEASIDGGTTFINVAGYPVGAGGVLGVPASSTTANDEWVFNLGGFSHFQVRASALASGTAIVATEANTGNGYGAPGAGGGGSIGSGVRSAVSLTRTADTNVYAANDILGAATGSTAALTFTNCGPAGGEIMITSTEMEIDRNAIISGEISYLLHLYNVTPPSASGDNAAFDLPSGDRASYLGSLNLGSPADLGSTLYIRTDIQNAQFTLVTSSLFAYLVTVGSYTPASATVHKITLHAVAL